MIYCKKRNDEPQLIWSFLFKVDIVYIFILRAIYAKLTRNKNKIEKYFYNRDAIICFDIILTASKKALMKERSSFSVTLACGGA